MFNSGASSGARDPVSLEAADATPLLYDEIRKDQYDCSHIAANQRVYSYDKVVLIKKHVFYKEYISDDYSCAPEVDWDHAERAGNILFGDLNPGLGCDPGCGKILSVS